MDTAKALKAELDSIKTAMGTDMHKQSALRLLTQLCDEQGAEIKRLSDWTSGGITWKKTAQIMRDKEAAESRAVEWASRCGKLQAELETAVDALSQAREEIQKEKAKVLSWQRSNARKATLGARTLMDLEASEQREKVLREALEKIVGATWNGKCLGGYSVGHTAMTALAAAGK